MNNLFLFQFCIRVLFVKNEDAPFYAQPIHVKGALARSFHIHRSMKIRIKFRITKMQTSESSVLVGEGSREPFPWIDRA